MIIEKVKALILKNYLEYKIVGVYLPLFFMTKCKICESALRPEIDKLLSDNANFHYVSKWCGERGFKVTSPTIKRHALEHIENFEYKPQPTSNLAIQKNNPTDNPIADIEVISFEAYCHAIGLQPDDFNELENNIERIITGSQKALSLLFFKAASIVDFKLTRYLINTSSYPSEEIRGLRRIFEMYVKVTGIELMIDENQAIQLLERLGYKISKTIL